MALNIKDPETDALAHKVAALTGQSITDCIKTALQEREQRVRRQAPDPDRRARLQRIIERARRRPVLDDRPTDELLGYNEYGLFD